MSLIIGGPWQELANEFARNGGFYAEKSKEHNSYISGNNKGKSWKNSWHIVLHAATGCLSKDRDNR